MNGERLVWYLQYPSIWGTTLTLIHTTDTRDTDRYRYTQQTPGISTDRCRYIHTTDTRDLYR
jgi:hypothetical protein